MLTEKKKKIDHQILNMKRKGSKMIKVEDKIV